MYDFSARIFFFCQNADFFEIVLVDAWEQCQGADVLLESPSAMAGVHIAEALSMDPSHPRTRRHLTLILLNRHPMSAVSHPRMSYSS